MIDLLPYGVATLILIAILWALGALGGAFRNWAPRGAYVTGITLFWLGMAAGAWMAITAANLIIEHAPPRFSAMFAAAAALYFFLGWFLRRNLLSKAKDSLSN